MARILSIEDDPDFQRLIGVALHREGHDVHYAFTGQEGYEKVLSLNPDLILLDLMLPILSGVEVLKKVRSHRSAWAIPVIVTTAHYKAPAFLEAEIRPLGVVEYLPKPVRLEDLILLIKRVARPVRLGTPQGLKLRKGEIRVDPRYRTVWLKDRLLATLPPKRFEVLFALVQSPGEVPKGDLLREVWEEGADENSLEKTIQRLREDFGPQEGRRIVTTLRGYELAG